MRQIIWEVTSQEKIREMISGETGTQVPVVDFIEVNQERDFTKVQDQADSTEVEATEETINPDHLHHSIKDKDHTAQQVPLEEEVQTQ